MGFGKKLSVLIAMVLIAVVLAAPALAQSGSRQVEGSFRLELRGGLERGQTFWISQRGLPADEAAPVCTTVKRGFGQPCLSGDNEVPFVAPKGREFRYKIYRYDHRSGEKQVIERGTAVTKPGLSIEAVYRATS
jgi:hypothetical protein